MKNALLPLCVLGVSHPLCALTITIDYTHGADFFGTNTVARAALEQAAADISSVISTQLSAITTDPIVGSSGGTTTTLNASFGYSNPATGATETIENTTLLGADQFIVYAGVRNLTGSTLGQGGSGGFGLSLGANGSESQITAATANAESLFNLQYLRGGPQISELNGSFTLGSTEVDYALDMGATIGNLWFDVDTDNNGETDSSGQLESFWHFDHTTAVASGKSDFYSVALHEILHTIAFSGGNIAFQEQVVNGTDWLGAEVIDELGTGTDVLDADSAHIKSGTMSIAVESGLAQEAVMDPELTAGTRKMLTTLDLAFLADTGWDISVVPEPATASLLLGLLVPLWLAGRRRRG